MAFRSRSRSPLKAAFNVENKEDHPGEDQLLETDVDVDIPMLTDEDIDNIVEDIFEKVDKKSETPNISQPMSPIRDVSVKEGQAPAEEIPAQTKDSKCSTPKEQIQAQDVTATEGIEMQPLGYEPNSKSEIDTIQKHVEDSLLFLDHGKDDKETINVPGKVQDNIDKTVPTYPSKEIVWENPVSVEAENKTEVLDKVDEMQAIGVESLPLKDAQKDANVVSDNVHLEASHIASTKEIMRETSLSVEKVHITTEIPEKIDENIENSESKPSIIFPAHHNVCKTSTSVGQSENTTECPENINQENLYSEPSQVSSMQNNVQETSMSKELAQTKPEIHEQMDEDVVNNVVLEPSQIKETIGQSQKKTDGPENMDEENNLHQEPLQVSPAQDVVLETSLSKELAQTESKIHEQMGKDVDNNVILEPSQIKETIGQSQNTTDGPENMDEENNLHQEPLQVSPAQDVVLETSLSKELAQTEPEIHEQMDEDVVNNFVLEPSQIKETIGQSQNSTDVPENMDEENNLHQESLQVSPAQDIVLETSLTKEPAQTESKIDEQMDKDVDNNVILEPSQIKETIVQSQNTTEAPENMDEENNLHQEPLQVSPAQDIVLETSLFKELAQTESKIHEQMDEDVDNNVIFEPSQIEKNIEHEIKCPENVNHNVPLQDIVWESSLSVEQAQKETKAPESMGEHIAPLQNTADEGLALNDAQDTGVVSEQTVESVDNNVQELSQITLLQEDSKGSPPLDIFIKETDKTDVHSESQQVSVQENFQKNQISSEHLQENVPGSTNNKVIINNPIQDISKKHSKSHENVVYNIQPSEIAPIEANIQESPISSAHEGPKNMVEHVDNTVPSEPSHTAPVQLNYEITSMLSEPDKEILASENNLEQSQIASKQIVVESPIISDNTTEIVEDMVEDVNLEPPLNAYLQEHVEETKTSSDLEKEMIDPEMNDENTVINIPVGPPEIDVKQKNDKDSTVSSENNITPEILNTKTDNNVNIEQTQIVPKQKSVWESPIPTEQTHKDPERNIENVIYHSKSAHSGALKAVPIQNQEQNTTIKPVESIIYNENSAHSGSLKVVPIQESVTEIAKAPQKHENLVYNTNSAHSGSLKVVPIRDQLDCPPAKRAKIEAKWTSNKSTDDSHPSNAVPAEESVHDTVSESLSAFYDAINTVSLAPSEVSAQGETANEASNRPRSSCSSIPEDNPMDIDSENSDVSVPNDTLEPHQKFEIKNMSTFTQWCKSNGIFDGSKNSKIPSRYANILKYSKHNKGVLRLSKVPKHFTRFDVCQLIRKHTCKADTEIVKKISFIYIDEDSCPKFKSALVKWRNQHMLDVVKTFFLLKKANLSFDGEKLRVAFDNRQKVDWTKDEKPIQRYPSVASRQSAAFPLKPSTTNTYVQPFTKGDIDFDDPALFGLSPDFLSKMGVKLPLTTDIFIKNLDVKEEENNLRQMFSAAGTVRDVRMFPNPEAEWLNVLIRYDHPLEAIQAISMFDQRVLNGQIITVSMTKGRLKETLSDGSFTVGRGLCLDGKPMLNIRTTVEVGLMKNKCDKDIEKLKKRVAGIMYKLRELKSCQDAIVSDTVDTTSQRITRSAKKAVETDPPNTMAVQQDPLNAMAALQQNPQNAMAALSTAIASSVQNNILGMLGLQPNILQGFIQQSQNSPTAPNWSAAPKTEISWTQPTQPNFSADTQKQPGQSYPLSGYANMQPVPNMQPAANVQPSPINMQLNSNVQTRAPIPNQSTYGNMQQGFAQPVYSLQSESLNMQPGSSNMQPGSSYMQPGSLYMQPGPSNMQPGTSNMQPGPSNMQTGPSNMQHGPSYMQPGPSNMQPGPTNMQSGPSNMQPLPSNMQPGSSNMQPGPSNVQPLPSNMQPGPSSMQPVPSNMQLGPSSMQSGLINMLSGPSNMPVQYPQSSTAQSSFSNKPQLNPVVYPPAPVTTNPATYDANQKKPVSRFDIPPIIVKPQNRGQTIPVVQIPPPVTLDIPLPIPKPQNRTVNVKTAFKIKNQNLKPVTVTAKPVGIKFNIPSLQLPAKPVPEVVDLDILPPEKKQKNSSQAKLPAYSKPVKDKSPDTEPWINKQIKAMRRNSKSPDRSRNNSPKYDKSKGSKEGKRNSKSPDRSRNNSPKYDKSKEGRRSRERDYSRDKERDSERDYSRSTTVNFKYLPSSVTLDDLREKMREVGRLVDSRSSGKGYATVTFRHRRDAETCIEMYNMAKVDGQTIEVKWAK